MNIKKPIGTTLALTVFTLAASVWTQTLPASTISDDKPSNTTPSQKPVNPKMNALLAYRANKFDEAYRWFEVSAKEHNDSFSMFYLGLMNAQGEGVKHDLHNAMRWYKQSCESGFDMACTAVEHLDKALRRGDD